MNDLHTFSLSGIARTIVFSALLYCTAGLPPAHAGWMCDSLGIGCGTDGADGVKIDQNNPPEVFSFTISGTFKDWTDIPKETFICDTRAREDRACIWEGYIPEIKRNATLVLEPFPHDLGMYDVRALIAHNLGRDTNFYADITDVSSGLGLPTKASISWLSENPFQMRIYPRTYSNVDLENDLGLIKISFQSVLK